MLGRSAVNFAIVLLLIGPLALAQAPGGPHTFGVVLVEPASGTGSLTNS